MIDNLKIDFNKYDSIEIEVLHADGVVEVSPMVLGSDGRWANTSPLTFMHGDIYRIVCPLVTGSLEQLIGQKLPEPLAKRECGRWVINALEFES